MTTTLTNELEGADASGDIISCAKSLGFVPYFTDISKLQLEALFYTATMVMNARYEELKEKQESVMSIMTMSSSEVDIEKHVRADMEMRKEMLLKR